MRLLLDSTFVVDLLAGLPEAVARQRTMFETGDEPFVNEVVVCEVRAGMRHRGPAHPGRHPGAGRVHPAGARSGHAGRDMARGSHTSAGIT